MTGWNFEFKQQQSMLPMQQLQQHFNLNAFENWPNAAGLNSLRSGLKTVNYSIPEFVCQSQMTESTLYYEQFIQQNNLIPTRPNSWHDLFNGLIWLQFPKTKRLLNQQHVADIQQYGLSPRSHRRNNLTHFDECGVIVTYQKETANADVIEQLRQHQWRAALVENRHLWGHEIKSFIFGHANLEMLLQPFIGLTGKFLAIAVEDNFTTLSHAQQLTYLDQRLMNHIEETDLFSTNKPLSPLPLLGIPNVWEANKDPKFYDNTRYFRALPLNRAKLQQNK